MLRKYRRLSLLVLALLALVGIHLAVKGLQHDLHGRRIAEFSSGPPQGLDGPDDDGTGLRSPI
jgi:hypothetical protein